MIRIEPSQLEHERLMRGARQANLPLEGFILRAALFEARRACLGPATVADALDDALRRFHIYKVAAQKASESSNEDLSAVFAGLRARFENPETDPAFLERIEERGWWDAVEQWLAACNAFEASNARLGELLATLDNLLEMLREYRPTEEDSC